MPETRRCPSTRKMPLDSKISEDAPRLGRPSTRAPRLGRCPSTHAAGSDGPEHVGKVALPLHAPAPSERRGPRLRRRAPDLPPAAEMVAPRLVEDGVDDRPRSCACSRGDPVAGEAGRAAHVVHRRHADAPPFLFGGAARLSSVLPPAACDRIAVTNRGSTKLHAPMFLGSCTQTISAPGYRAAARATSSYGNGASCSMRASATRGSLLARRASATLYATAPEQKTSRSTRGSPPAEGRISPPAECRFRRRSTWVGRPRRPPRRASPVPLNFEFRRCGRGPRVLAQPREAVLPRPVDDDGRKRRPDRHVLERARAGRVVQQKLGREDDEGLPLRRVDLPPQQVKCCAGVDGCADEEVRAAVGRLAQPIVPLASRQVLRAVLGRVLDELARAVERRARAVERRERGGGEPRGRRPPNAPPVSRAHRSSTAASCVASIVPSSSPSTMSKASRIASRSSRLNPGSECASSLTSCRKRSTRALLCSGPWPSKPCGSSSTRLLWPLAPHLSSPELINWSM